MSLREDDQRPDDIRRETFSPQVERPGDPSLTAAAAALTGEFLSEDRVALEFVARHGAGVRYDHSVKSWFVYDGQRWPA